MYCGAKRRWDMTMLTKGLIQISVLFTWMVTDSEHLPWIQSAELPLMV